MDFEISLHHLRFHAYHGILEHEREFGNEFTVDLSVKIPADLRIAEDDDLIHTISYAILFEIVKDEMEKPRKLLETVALKLAERIKATFPEVKSGKVKIEKNRPPIREMSGSASVSLEF